MIRNRNKMRCYASCSFGLEAVVARELKELGMEQVAARDARVYFDADEQGIAAANLWLSAADRVYLVLGEFTARTFDELFEGVRAIPWRQYLPKDASFPVTGDAVRAELMSVSDIQSLAKKAIVERLKEDYRENFFRESGWEYPVYINNLADRVTVSLNTSGMGLNRRGYRTRKSKSPIRETLAAGMIHLSRWYDRPFYDVMCGSGTIPIEAALKAQHRAPGLYRAFAAEKWSDAFAEAFSQQRERARDLFVKHPDIQIFASDIDPAMVELTAFHAKKAGVEDVIAVSRQDATKFIPQTSMGTLISNPPYAADLSERSELEKFYRKLGQASREWHDFRYYFICADEEFSKFFGRKEDKRRKLYNGNVRHYFYQYFRGGDD